MQFKAGTTFNLVVEIKLEKPVDSVIITLQNKAGEQLHKEFTQLINDVLIIPLSQEETTLLQGQVQIEAQLNYSDNSVGKTQLSSVYISPTIYTEMIEDSHATNNSGIDAVLKYITDGVALVITPESSSELLAEVRQIYLDTKAEADEVYEAYTSGELKGEKGDKGDKGDTGERGPQGPEYDDTEIQSRMTAIEDSQEYLGANVSLEMDALTYVVTLSLKNRNNLVIGTTSIDLPLESTIVGGRYDADNQAVVLELQSGEELDIPVSDLIQGLVSTDELDITLSALMNDRAVGKHYYISSTSDSAPYPPVEGSAYANKVNVGDIICCFPYYGHQDTYLSATRFCLVTGMSYAAGNDVWYLDLTDIPAFRNYDGGLVFSGYNKAATRYDAKVVTSNDWDTLAELNLGNSTSGDILNRLDLSALRNGIYYPKIRILFNAKSNDSSNHNLDVTLTNGSNQSMYCYSGMLFNRSNVNTYEIILEQEKGLDKLYNGTPARVRTTWRRINGSYGYGQIVENVSLGVGGTKMNLVNAKYLTISSGPAITNTNESIYVIIQGRRF